MANIFRKKDAYIDRVNRSTFDLSFVNNLTMKFGAITPVCLLPASFGDSFQINARFNLQLLPTVFPIQTQLYVRLHFVYVRTRTLWEDWMSFFGGDETVTPPWMDVLADGNTPERKRQFNVSDDLQTGSLADYLGVPTTITGSYSREYESNKVAYDLLKGIAFSDSISSTPVIESPVFPAVQVVGSPDESIADFYNRQVEKPLSQIFVSNSWAGLSVGYQSNYIGIPYVWNAEQIGIDTIEFRIPTKWFSNLNSPFWVGFYDNIGAKVTQFSYNDFNSYSVQGDYYVVSASKSAFKTVVQLVFWVDIRKIKKDYVLVRRVSSYSDGSGSKAGELYSIDILNNFYYTASTAEWTKPESANCPFYASSGMPAIPLSALPFRAYESYYNAFGRDIRNNPFIVDGKPEYNKYVPSVKGGRDSYKYQLHYANWEPDAYTTALQSPQAGVAPLVGITSLGEATFRDAAGTEYRAQLETAEDGDTVTGFQVKSSNAPADVVRNLIGMATSGISISDFRNVNSLQRFLEIRVRQSPRYKNLVKGLFDVNLDYDELMMPEFLGGISDTIPVYKVTQTTPTEGNPLGSFAGQGSLQSGMRHIIRKYCPEDGYILGVSISVLF